MRGYYLISVIFLCIYLGSIVAHNNNNENNNHKCIHEELYKEYKEERVPQSYPSSKQRTTPQPIRITADTSLVTTADPRSCQTAGSYVKIGNPTTQAPNPACASSSFANCWYLCTANDVVTTTKRDLIVNTLMPTATALFASFLKVIPVSGNLVLTSGNCGSNGGVTVPASYVSPGVANADLVLFITARPAEASVLAWAIECRSDNKGRAIAGQVNIAPASLTDASQSDYYMRVVMHEIIHVLGFNSYKYSSYINPTTGQPLATVTSPGTGPKGNAITQIVTPKALQYAREFFNCPSLSGVAIEDGGGSGSAGSHWEKRIFWDDIMNPSASRPQVISRVTLGLLEDMGWYYPDYSVAEVSNWGKNQGCQFPTGPCNQWTQPSTSCLAAGDVCSIDSRYLASCRIVRYSSSLPSQYQWFSDPTMGGDDQFSDYCPLVSPYSNGDCTVVDPNQQNTINQKNYYGSVRGPSSRCFEATLTNKSYVPNANSRVTCYPTQCVSGVLQVGIAGTYYPCPQSGGNVANVNSFTGYVKCPPSNVICSSDSSTPPAPTQAPPPPPPPEPTPSTAIPVTPVANFYIFQESLGTGWAVSSTSTVTLCGSGLNSACAVSVPLPQNANFAFSSTSGPFSLTGYSRLYFSIRADTPTIVTASIDNYSANVQATTTWSSVYAALASFGNPSTITAITFKNSGSTSSNVYVDNVYLSP